MEDIIQILIFVGAMVIAVIGQSAKSKKKPDNPSPEEVLEDMFPEIEVVQEATETPSPEPLRPKVKAPKRTSRHTKPVPRPAVTNTPPPAPAKSDRKIRISSPQEARRAFIHSEIFNRKY
jgi:hypothetical protein